MKNAKPFRHPKFGVSFFLFSAGFLVLFYLPLCLFVPGFTVEPYYVGLNFLLFSLVTVAVLFMPGYTPPYLFLLSLFLGFPAFITSSYAMIYRQMPDPQIFFFIWETNTREVSEFLQDSIARSPQLIYFVVLSIALLASTLILLLRQCAIIKTIKWHYRLGVVLPSLCLVFFMYQAGAVGHNYVYNFYSSYVRHSSDLKTALKLSNLAAERIKTEKIESTRSEDTKETYVIVIGESASRHHMGMYGYCRETDPRMADLKKRGELYDFDNVISNSIGTTVSLSQALTFLGTEGITTRDIGEKLKYSVVDVFNGAGFETTWLSNNAVMLAHDTLLQTLSRNADTRIYTEKKAEDLSSLMNKGTDGRGEDEIVVRDRGFKAQDILTYDGVLLPLFKEALASDAKKKAIIVHLKGSHVVYWYRFPNEFEKFKQQEGFPISDDQIDYGMINDYDNSIYYTDYILAQLVSMLKAEKGESWLMYFGDHAEEVYDYRDFRGRSVSLLSKFMLDVPFFLWFSDDYAQERDVSVLRDYRDRPYELGRVIHTILDLANIKMNLLDETKSIVSDKYVLPARYVLTVPYLLLEPDNLYNPKTVYAEVEALERDKDNKNALSQDKQP